MPAGKGSGDYGGVEVFWHDLRNSGVLAKRLTESVEATTDCSIVVGRFFAIRKTEYDFYCLYLIKFITAYLDSKKNRYEVCKCKIKFVFTNILFAKRVEKFADLCYNIRNIDEISWEGFL